MSKVVAYELDKKYLNIQDKNIKSEVFYTGHISGRVKQSSYSYARFNEIVNGYSKPITYLPFRVSFQNISVSKYVDGQPIGIAIIGLSNYIL